LKKKKEEEKEGLGEGNGLEVDAGACPQGHPKDNQGQGDEDQEAWNEQIQAPFSFTSSRVCAVLGSQFGETPQVMIEQVLLCWTP